jgi:hypothetical protein
MTSLLLLLSLPCVLWTQGLDTAPTLKEAGITRVCVAPEAVDGWKAAGFDATPIAAADLAARDALLVPGIVPRPGLASPTRVPWVNTNGWKFARAHGGGKYSYDAPARRGALAIAEAFAYGVDAVVKIDPADVKDAGRMLTALAEVPAADGLTPVADLAVVDDGTPITGEVMNLLTRRNLLFEAVKAPSKQFPINIKLGSKEYPIEEAADPSVFALKIRRELTDERRSIRLYGSEVIVARLTRKGDHARVQLVNYGGREIDGLRIRVRGAYTESAAYIAGTGKVEVNDFAQIDGGTEFSLPRMGPYAVIDLTAKAK